MHDDATFFAAVRKLFCNVLLFFDKYWVGLKYPTPHETSAQHVHWRAVNPIHFTSSLQWSKINIQHLFVHLRPDNGEKVKDLSTTK